MADFSVNIDPKKLYWYAPSVETFQNSPCAGNVTDSQSVGIYAAGAAAAQNYALASYDQPLIYPYKNLIIDTNLSDSPTTFYLAYNGVAIPYVGDTIIDIESLVSIPGQAIPLLTVEFVNQDPTVAAEISFFVSIETTSGYIGERVRSYYYSLPLTCE